MKHDYKILSKRISLRPIEEGDIENLRVLRNANRQYFLSDNEITAEQQKKWYAHYLEKKDDIMFVVENRNRPGEFGGAISLYDIDWNTGKCEVGRTVMNKEVLDFGGVGAEATAAICAFGFDHLSIKTVIGHCYIDNVRMMKANLKAGMIFMDDQDPAEDAKNKAENVQYMEMTSQSVNREIIS